jgi:hypothetical protein
VFGCDKYGFKVLPMLQDKPEDRYADIDEVQNQVLAPSQVVDHAAAGAGDIAEEVKQNDPRVNRKYYHYDQ